VNHLEVARPEITEISPYNEHVAGIAEREITAELQQVSEEKNS
jgi:hypothetical protein